MDRELAQTLIERAHIVCPYSNATRNNIDVRLSPACPVWAAGGRFTAWRYRCRGLTSEQPDRWNTSPQGTSNMPQTRRVRP